MEDRPRSFRPAIVRTRIQWPRYQIARIPGQWLWPGPDLRRYVRDGLT